MKWLETNICFLTIAGSQSYGMNTSESDLDIKGICLPPKEVRQHLFHRFDQAINNEYVEEKHGHLKNPKNPKLESTVYSLEKFFKLAANLNPNVTELLYVDRTEILAINEIGEEIIKNRDMFLSTKARFTYAGYAYAQFHKIERHRKWLLKGELEKPERQNYGLKEKPFKGYAEIDRLIKKELQSWNLSKYELDNLDRQQLQESMWECIYWVSGNKVDWGNWPEKYEQAALAKFIEEFDISAEVSDLILRETRYKNDLREYQDWQRWKEQRNPARKELEAKSGYDTKHGAHLMRLMRSGCEVLEGKGIITKRPDAQELLSIRNGAWTYDKLMEEFNALNVKMDELYKITKLPRSVNYEKINDFYYNLLEMDESSVKT